MKTIRYLLLITAFSISVSGYTQLPKENEPNIDESLSLWNIGVTKSSILSFVDEVTNKKSTRYIPVEDRVAVFDMDGTILIEKPNYVIFDFVIRQMHERIKEDAGLKNKQPHKAIYEEDWAYFDTLDWNGDDGLYSILLHATSGFTNQEYKEEVLNYFKTVKDKRFGVSYSKLVYAPVIQLIKHLQDNQFEVYIVSGSDPQFTRTFCRETANIPSENVIGTTVLTQWIETDSTSHFVRQHAFVQPINDVAGKPVNILNKIGKLPVIAVGNSTGDYHMLEYSKNAPYSLQLIVNHDDADREYNYHAEKMKKLCEDKNWIEVSMKKDFKVVFKQME